MLIVSAGRGRSGSTLLYNLIRLTLIETTGDVYARSHRHYDKKATEKYHVVKIHGHNNYLWKNADYVFSSIRNEKDQKNSMKKHVKLEKGYNRTDKQLEKQLAEDKLRWERWKSHRNFVKTFDFNKLVNDKLDVIDELCRVFKVWLVNGSNDSILSELDSLRTPKKGFDKETCLTSHHFTSKRFIEER